MNLNLRSDQRRDLGLLSAATDQSVSEHVRMAVDAYIAQPHIARILRSVRDSKGASA